VYFVSLKVDLDYYSKSETKEEEETVTVETIDKKID